MSHPALASMTLTASPIGSIPVDFPKMKDLCRQANIRYHDAERDGVKTRTWRVLTDGKDTHTVLIFEKFKMLLDILQHENPGWDRTMLLDAALSPNPHRKLLALDWKDMHDRLAHAGVHGYQPILRKKKATDSSFAAFRDVLAD